MVGGTTTTHSTSMTFRSVGSFLLLFLPALAASPACAHEDTLLRITKNGEIVGFPNEYGMLRVDVEYTKERDVRSVRFSGKGFSIKLKPCVLKRMKGISVVLASGSWYHDLERHPPYVHLDFMQAPPSEENFRGVGVGVTFSVQDGRILMAQRHANPWFGRAYSRVSFDATTCKKWDELWSML